jgi:hypothetical protein
MTAATPQQVMELQGIARHLAKLYRVNLTERGDTFVFARRLEVNFRANAWQDLKTGEVGKLKTTLAELLRKFFPQIEQAQIGGAR